MVIAGLTGGSAGLPPPDGEEHVVNTGIRIKSKKIKLQWVNKEPLTDFRIVSELCSAIFNFFFLR